MNNKCMLMGAYLCFIQDSFWYIDMMTVQLVDCVMWICSRLRHVLIFTTGSVSSYIYLFCNLYFFNYVGILMTY